jgi:hypothetical protein
MVLGLTILAPEVTAAHDVTYDLRGTGDVRIAFHYSDGTPMSDATFQVFAPNAALAKSAGTTDSAGEMEFRAVQDGPWSVEASDANGHMSRARINVTQGWPDTATRTVPSWFVTVSLVLNILLGLKALRGLGARPRGLTDSRLKGSR